MSEQVLLQGESTAVTIYGPASYKADAILIHGFTGSKEDFDYMAPLLAERGYRTFTFDNRGAHESAHTTRPGAYTVDSMAQDVLELSAHYGLSKPHLFGHSLGGVIAQRVASKSADQFASLTLMCSGPSPMPAPKFATTMLETLDGRSMDVLWREEVEGWYKDHLRFDLMKKRWLASDWRALISLANELMNFSSLVPQIAGSGIPTHVLYGESDDAWPPAMQDQMAHDLGAHLSVIKDAGHCPNEDQPAATADATAHYWDLIQ